MAGMFGTGRDLRETLLKACRSFYGNSGQQNVGVGIVTGPAVVEWESRAMEAFGELDLNTFTTEQLKLELQQERRMKEMLERSTFEMKSTVAELEKRLNNVEDEGNEWKTRYETQIELNQQLENQISLLKEKIGHIRGSPADRLASIRSYDEMPVGALNQFLKQLEMEKISLENQLKNFLLRMEQEAKTSVANDSSKKQKTDLTHCTRESKISRGMYNIPPNQRMLDPRKGPIKKTAGVKHLPKITVT
ncbi:coiled-coil domain-containing protein 169 isoform X2 [Ambystoma mexicanum]|uniref:coiled-coil domain-containing protein 169 isoform X2 n=1 Tax=Ambystoma mexicanum TaxID=8296 RepID=UPI0037E939C5